MRVVKTVLVILVVCIISIPLFSCGSESESAESSENQVYTVQRGDLAIDITAVGNLALSYIEDLAFEAAGIVEEVLVDVGDSVKEGQVMANLDTSAWEDQLKTLDRALVLAERNLTKAERQVSSKELAVSQAELDVQTAEYNLYQITEVKKAKDAVEKAEYEIEIAKGVMKTIPFGQEWWSEKILEYQAALKAAEEKLLEVLSGTSVILTNDTVLDIANKQQQLLNKQKQLEDARIAVDDALIAIEDAKLDVEDAQTALAEAESLSPIITAPFNGFVTKVNVKGGDEVKKGTIAVQIADPDKFETEIMVSEMDILNIKLGQYANVQIDAMPTFNYSANVTRISPTATIQQGVVNYRVKVVLESLEAIRQERQDAMQQTMQDIASGEMPERMKQAIEDGLMTQEQAEEIMERMKEMRERGFTPPSGGGEGEMPFGPPGGGEMPSPPEGFEGEMTFPPFGGFEGESPFQPGGSQIPMVATEDFQLREGLTVTVSIVISESTDVLLVPNQAISYQGMQAYVQVTSPDGVTEECPVQVGISDFQFTEIIDGLSEGDEIVVPQGTATLPTQENRPGGFMIPMGGRR